MTFGLLLACSGESDDGSQGTGSAAAGGAGGGSGAGNGGLSSITCWNLTGYPDLLPSPNEAMQVTGSNGTFVDECDADGNVVEYHCPMQQQCGGGMDCAPYPTGLAAPRTVTCEAGCEGGVCIE